MLVIQRHRLQAKLLKVGQFSIVQYHRFTQWQVELFLEFIQQGLIPISATDGVNVTYLGGVFLPQCLIQLELANQFTLKTQLLFLPEQDAVLVQFILNAHFILFLQ